MVNVVSPATEKRGIALPRVIQASGQPADDVRAAFARFPTGVAAICALVDGEPVGLVASSFSVGVSYMPAMVMFAVQNSSTTWPRLAGARRLGVSILGADHHDLCLQLASRSRDRFAGVETTVTPEGALLVGGSVLWLECEVHSTTPAGDHQIIVMEVHGLAADAPSHPLVYQQRRFHHLTDIQVQSHA